MAKSNNVLLGVFVSFVIIMVLIALVRAVFHGVLRDGFADLSCYGVACNEGQFCQDKVCRDINPKYQNNYYDEGIDSFKNKDKMY